MSTNLYTNGEIDDGLYKKGFPFNASLDEMNPSSAIMQAWIQAGRFNGALRIPNTNLAMPVQEFVVSSKSEEIRLESHSNTSWPSISILLLTIPNENPRVKFEVRVSNNTVESQLLYTRVLYALNSAGICLLASGIGTDNQPTGMGFSFEKPSAEFMRTLLFRGKIVRKLKFIKDIFGFNPPFPENINEDDLPLIDHRFRGITEGEFVTRGRDITLLVKAAEANFSEPPFSEIGPYKHYMSPDNTVIVNAGPIWITLKKSIIANHMHLVPLRQGKDSPVRFEVLDNQITFRYEKYASSENHEQIQQRLRQFHSQLKQEEPVELADTLLEPLMPDVLSDEALEIAVGWQESSGLPDRFCPQEPILDEEHARWRVPIHLVYTSGKGGPVGELLVDLKTGSVTEQPSVDEMRQRATVLAEKIFRVG